MKKIFAYLLGAFLVVSCSATDDNSSKDIAPLSPTELTGGLTGSTQVTLNWTDNATNETGYIVERQIKGDNYSQVGTVGSDITNYVDNDLLENTTYYYRVLAYNKVGNSPTYSNQVGITTSKAIVIPILTTTEISTISYTTAKSGGNIASDGGSTVTSRGVVWSILPNPTIELKTKTPSGTGIGGFECDLGELNSNTTYYVSAYATNSVGTSYGQVVVFKTLTATLPILPSSLVSNIQSTSAQAGAYISSDGGSTITARGVVWSTLANPTIELSNKTSEGSGIGDFTSSLNKLSPKTLYYMRAYATNSVGTAYGSQIGFTTTAAQTSNVSDIDGNSYPIIQICEQTWMQKNLNVSHYRNGDVIPQVTDPKEWASLTTGAWCYYANNTANGLVYGKMYNWYAVNDSRGLAPQGWHIPSDAEWRGLTDCLGGTAIAGGKMKQIGTALWSSPNTGATNSWGFTALPGGQRNYFGNFETIQVGSWWSSDGSGTYGIHRSVLYDKTNVIVSGLGKETGIYVRCIKD